MQRALWLLALVVSCARSAPPSDGFDEGQALPGLQLHGFEHGAPESGAQPATSFEVAYEAPAAQPRLLLVHTVMAWCGHCIQETAAEMKMVEAAPRDFRIVQVLVQDEYGDPAKLELLERWVRLRRSKLPTGIDLSGGLGRKFPSAATFILVDVRDHRRVRYVGSGPKGFAQAQERAGAILGVSF